jgi:LPXTG-motif cell wall-anchored protein
MNMNVTRKLALFGLVVSTVALSPLSRADQWNQKTFFTFSGPVEVPGRVLPKGTYVFKLADSRADRNIVQVYSQDERHLLTTCLAIPQYRMKATSKPVLTFEERANGAPQAVKTWFYPGENYGHGFVYPEVKKAQVAQVHKQPPPPIVKEVAPQPVAAPQPEEEIAPEMPPAEPEPPVEETPAPAPAPELPKTGSVMPLIALLGLGSLLTAACLHLLAERV